TVKTTWPMLGLKHQVAARLPVHSLRVAMTVGPDLRPRILLTDERIVLRHSAVVVQSQSFAGERVELLGQLALRRVAGGDVELAVGSETNTTTGMKLRGRNVFDDHLAIDKTFRCLAIARDPHLVSGVRIRQVNEMIAAELRMQRHAHQATLAG